MDVKRLAIRGVMFNWLGRACALIVTFVVTPILVHELGNEAYGLWAVVISFSGYYALADLGLRDASVKYISQFEAVDDRESVNKVVLASLAAYSLLSLGVLLLAGMVAVAFPYVFDTGSQTPSTIRWVVMLTGASVALGLFGHVFSAILSATKRFDFVNVAAVGSLVLQSVLCVVLLKRGHGLLAMATVVLLVGVVRELAYYLLARHVLGYLSLSPRRFRWDTLRLLMRFGSLSLFQGIALKFYKSAGAIIVGAILGPATVTFYVLADSLVRKCGDVTKGVSSVIMPVSSQLHTEGRRDDLARLYCLGTGVLLALSCILAITLLSLGKPLMETWIGPGYGDNTFPVLCILCLSMIFNLPGTCGRKILTGMNRMRFLAKVSLLDVVGITMLGIILVWLLGVVGMAYAVLATQVVTAGLLVPMFACRLLGVSVRRFAREVLFPGVVASLPSLLVALAFVQWWPATTLLQVGTQGAVIVLTGGVSVFFLALDGKTRSDVVRALRAGDGPSAGDRTPRPALPAVGQTTDQS